MMEKLSQYVTNTEHLNKTDEIIDFINGLESGGGVVTGGGGVHLLKRNTEYRVGEICFHEDLESNLHLRCTQAGRTADTIPPGLNSVTLGDTFKDGTAIFKAYKHIPNDENFLYVGKDEPEVLTENLIIVDPDELLEDSEMGILDYIMVGATDSKDGRAGFVPTPTQGASNRYLCVDGSWKVISGGSGGNYTLPIATKDTLGGIKVGSNITVTSDGTLSVSQADIEKALGYGLADLAEYITEAELNSNYIAKGPNNNLTINKDLTIASNMEIKSEGVSIKNGHLSLPSGIEIY